ncbi:putative FIP [Sesbania bispinosa]|nr:putative FIP [Sesbania bispinosa]
MVLLLHQVAPSSSSSSCRAIQPLIAGSHLVLAPNTTPDLLLRFSPPICSSNLLLY